MSESSPGVEAIVARRIGALRREAGLTLREMGAKTGLSDAYLSRVENGQIAITLASLEKLAEVFATPITTFFEGEAEPQRLVLERLPCLATGRPVPATMIEASVEIL